MDADLVADVGGNDIIVTGQDLHGDTVMPEIGDGGRRVR